MGDISTIRVNDVDYGVKDGSVINSINTINDNLTTLSNRVDNMENNMGG